MLNTKNFGGELLKHFDFFTGVPDSLLKSLCSFFTSEISSERHIVAANEGNSIALAAGHYLATGNPGLVYMQNSGLGNATNPLISLNDRLVYGIPVLLFVGWRGEPNVKDEPQHAKQGLITTPFFDLLGIKYQILSDNYDEAVKQLSTAVVYMRENKEPYAFVIKKGTFDEYKIPDAEEKNIISRESAIEKVIYNIPDSFVVSTTGMISRELFEIRNKRGKNHKNDFLTVGSMGHCSQIALGLAIELKNKKIVCLDGDGAILMHMGGMALIAALKPKNFIHVVFNNGAHDSVGGQPTVADKLDLSKIAKAMGYPATARITEYSQLEHLSEYLDKSGPVFIEIVVKKGARDNLGRPTQTPMESKKAFMQNFIK